MSTPTTTITGPASEEEATAHKPVPTRRPRLVRAEIRKIVTTNSWWIIGLFLLLATGLALLINVSQANDSLAAAENALAHPLVFPDDPSGRGPTAGEQQEALEEWAQATDISAILARGAASVYTSGQFFGLLLVVIVGALVVTNEFQHQTVASTFLTTPRRTRVISAKLAAAIGLAGAYWLFATLVSAGIGALNFAVQGYGVPLADPTVLRAVGMNLLAYCVWAVIGVGLGVLLRGQLGATLTATGLYLSAYPGLILFSVLFSLIGQDWVFDLVVLMPGIASMIMTQTEELQLGFDVYGPPWWAGAIALVGYGVVAGVIGTLIMRKRDVS